MERSVRILHVDDDPDVADLTATFLERENDRFGVEPVTSVRDALDRLDVDTFDCIISDYDMPEQNGIEFLRTVREEFPDLPFVLYTGKGSEEVASEAISAGVTDYLQKGAGTAQYTVLANRITNAVDQYRSTNEIEASQKRLSLFIEQSPLGVIEWNQELEMVRLNDAAESILGYTEDDLLGETWTKIVPETEREHVSEILHKLLENEGGYHTINENVRKDGEKIVCEWHNRVVTDENDDVVTIFSQFQDITERQNQREELERHRAVIQAATNTIVTIDESNTIVSVNPSVEETFGYEPDELVGEPLAVLMSDGTAERHTAAFERYLETGERTLDWENVEFEGQHRDGTPIPLSATFGERTYEGDRYFVGVLRDISERKRRERELNETNALLSTLFETLPVGILAEDENRQVLAVNERMDDLFGLPSPQEELIGADCVELARKASTLLADPDGFIERINDLVANHDAPVHEELALRDGRTFSRIYRPIELPDGGGHLWTYWDITDEKERRREIQQTRREYEELINGMNDSAWVIGLDGTFITVNDAAVERTGYSREELRSMTPHDIDVGLDNDELSDLIENLSEDEIQVFETVHETKDGERIPVEISSNLISYRGDTVVLSIARDISERKRREKRLEQFASIVSHDLRNPLDVALGRIELATEECDSEHLPPASAALNRMNGLIEDLLELAREGDEIGEVEPVELADLAEMCWQHVDTAEATVRIRIDRTIRADRSRLAQLLENLFRNAVEHGGADVSITIGALDDGFYVEDDGAGIGDHSREKVFAPGYSTDEDGTGFGLAIVRQITHAHGWRIRLTDGSGGGARFEITGVNGLE